MHTKIVNKAEIIDMYPEKYMSTTCETEFFVISNECYDGGGYEVKDSISGLMFNMKIDARSSKKHATRRFTLHQKIEEIKIYNDKIKESGKIPAVQLVGESCLPHWIVELYASGCRKIFITDINEKFLDVLGKVINFFKSSKGVDYITMEDKYKDIVKLEETKTVQFRYVKKGMDKFWAFSSQERFNNVCEAFNNMKIDLCKVNVFSCDSQVMFREHVEKEKCEISVINVSNVLEYLPEYQFNLLKNGEIKEFVKFIGKTPYDCLKLFSGAKSGCLLRMSCFQNVLRVFKKEDIGQNCSVYKEEYHSNSIDDLCKEKRVLYSETYSKLKLLTSILLEARLLLINTSDSTIKLSNSMYIRQHLGVAASLAEVLTSLSEVLTKERLNFVLSKIPGEDPRLKTCLLIYLLIENDFVFSGKDLIVYSLFSILIALPEESTEHEYNSLHLAIYGLLDIYGFVNDCNVDAEYKVIKSFVDAICNCIKTNPQCNEGGLDLDILKDYMIKTLDQKTELQHVSAGTNNTLSELGVTAQCNASYCSII